MDLQTRKIEFIQEFLKIQSEDAVKRLERLLRKEKRKISNTLDAEELNERIELSESDFENNRFKSSSELIEKYK